MKDKRMILKWLTGLIGLILFAAALVFANGGNFGADPDEESFLHFERARVMAILEDNSFFEEETWVRLGFMILEVEVLSGDHEGEIIPVHRHFGGHGFEVFLPGDTVLVRYLTDDGSILHGEALTPERSHFMIGFVAVFIIVLALVGGKQGIMSVLGLGFTLVSIFFLLYPLMLRGWAAIPTTIAILTLVTVVTLIMLGGYTRKTYVAIIGCMVGVLSAALLAEAAGRLVHLGGYHTEDVGSLIWIAAENGFSVDVSGLFISGVLIASLGAVMDTSMSIASSMEEIRLANPNITGTALFKSGLNIGRDAMGTMSNTLILAFAGTSINLALMIYAHNMPFLQVINHNMIGIELIRSVAGSLGIILTVPAAAFIGSRNLFSKKAT